MQRAETTLLTAALIGALSVGMGAFGVHGLEEHLSQNERWNHAYQLAYQYGLNHALAMIAVGILQQTRPGRFLSGSSLAFTVGVILFSGSLYIYALTGVRAWGAVTPFGGLAFITGWLLLALYAIRIPKISGGQA